MSSYVLSWPRGRLYFKYEYSYMLIAAGSVQPDADAELLLPHLSAIAARAHLLRAVDLR